MDLTDKTAQPSMEEILASIRKLLSEESDPRQDAIDFNARPIMLNDDDEEETSEFDLPAIFRSSSPVERMGRERSSASLVRLTDAIRTVTGGMATVAYEAEVHTQSSTAEPLKGLSSLKVEETYRVEATVSALPHRELELAGVSERLDDSSFFEDEGQLAPVRSEAPAQQAAPVVTASSEPSDVRRVMAPFKDTKFKSLASPSAASPPASVEARPQASAPGGMVEPKLPSPPSNGFDFKREPVLPSYPPPRKKEAIQGLAPSFQQAALVHREEAPQANVNEEAAADLLRPMLRSWLAENMPKMVEKALVLEMNQQLANLKKSGGSES